MKRKRRTEILVKGDKNIAKKISEEIENKYSPKMIEAPNHGLTMVKSRECGQKTLFYLGEVLVTECKVSINGHIGLGIVQGDEEELAYHLALIDAAYESDLAEIPKWHAMLLEEEERIKEEADKKTRQILMTKVDFSTMDVEV